MSNPANINYLPLTGMRHAGWTTFKNSFKDPLGIVAFVALVLGAPIGAILLAPGLATIVIGPVLYGLFLGHRIQGYKTGLWEAFAQANGWPLDNSTPIGELVPPSMQFGHSPHFSPVIQAQLGPLSCDLFSYNTTVGEGKYSHTYYYTMARMPLPVLLPHMLLLSKKAGAELQRDLANKQDVQLEGDFEDYFKLQIEQGQQIDALTVITPDVMQTLVQYNQAEDIEILSADLYFIMGLDNRSLARVQHLIESAAALSQQIMQNIAAEQGSASSHLPSANISEATADTHGLPVTG